MIVTDDMQFDRLVQEQLERFPPEPERIEQADPFSHPVYLILWGIALQTLTLGLVSLMGVPAGPAVGAALVYCGARSLRNLGPWFRALYLLSIARMGALVLGILLYMLPVSGGAAPDGMALVLVAAGALGAGVQAGVLLSLAFGFRRLFLIHELRGASRLLAAAAFFLASLGFSALLPAGGLQTLGVLVALGLFFLLAAALIKMEDGLESVGYGFHAAPVRFPAPVIVGCFLLLLSLSLVGGGVLSNHPVVQGQPADGLSDPAAIEAGILLAEKGLPQEVLENLSASSILMLSDAERLLTFSKDAALREAPDFSLSLEGMVWGGSAGGAVGTTTVVFHMPDGTLFVLSYFDWRDHKAYWGDIVAIYGHEELAMELMEGRLLYEKGQETWTAPFPELEEGVYQTSSFGGQLGYTVPAILGRASYPFGSGGQRGYILYRTQDGGADWLDIETGYVHFPDPFRFPHLPLDREISAAGGMEGYVQHSFPLGP